MRPSESTDSLLPGFEPPAPKAPTPPPAPAEARGRIGALATAYGVVTKAEESTGATARFFAIPDDALVPLPTPDPAWSPDDIERVSSLSCRAHAVGQTRLANLWRLNLARPKAMDLDGLERMTLGMERAAAGKKRELGPVEPALVSSLTEFLQGAAYPASLLPAVIRDAVLHGVNQPLHDLASAGFRAASEVRYGNAPADIVEKSCRISRIGGSCVRVLNQLGHLLTVSRAGQTAHAPMTLARRTMLVEDALAGLAEELEVPAWRLADLDVMSPALLAAWDDRAVREPYRPVHPRSLFEWAAPAPMGLSDEKLDHLIQSHPDLEYVEKLRDERRRRAELRTAAGC